MSPTPASGSLLRCAPKPNGSIKNNDFAPLLSAQLRTAPTGSPRVIRNFEPEAPPAEIGASQKFIMYNVPSTNLEWPFRVRLS